MKVLLTGAGGFLGWHTRVRLHALTDHDVVPVARDEWRRLEALVEGVDAIVHVAGVNRGSPADVESGNVRLATDMAQAITRGAKPFRVIFANSIQAGNDTPYGTGKQQSSDVLAGAVRALGGHFVDVRLPNLFGEHARPSYNSFVATFVDALGHGDEPAIEDRPVDLLHAQSAAQSLIEGLDAPAGVVGPNATPTSVQEVWDLLREFDAVYAGGDIPALDSDLRIDLFNTYRAGLFPSRYPIPLRAHTDERGRLVETVRSHGGQGQTFISTTRPGGTRGQHFHLGKVERFVVLSGQARISLRRMFHDEVVTFDVSGQEPSIVDMPTMWAHDITNVGDTELTTLFWTHSLFDPGNPDTFAEAVTPAHREVFM